MIKEEDTYDIAEVLNARHSPDEAGSRFDYIDFHGGISMLPPKGLSESPAVCALYAHCFERLKKRGCTWAYHPPAIFVVDMSGPRDDVRRDENALEAYDPYSGVAEELGLELESEDTPDASEDGAGDGELSQLKEAAQEANAKARRKALEGPPTIVQAYRAVYGRWPAYIKRN